MDMLEQALKSHLPFIHVKTDDLLHIQEVLAFIAEEEVRLLPKNQDGSIGDLTANIYYTGDEIALPKIYLEFKAQGKTLVFVNTKPSVLHFGGGTLLPPKKMMLNYLRDLMEDGENAEQALPAFGGMTLKEMYEAVKLTEHRTGSITAKGINETRRGYISRLKGVTQVDTDYDFYQPPSYLDKWLQANAKFFLKPVLPSLTPRGLLFDGSPGTGKTAASKYIANTFNLPLYHLDIGAVKEKYVGNSESNLHAALAQIDSIAPCVVLIDEVEKIFTSSGDAGVTSSLLGTMLWWLQEHKTQVFTLMTTNNKNTIPKELYREGRIDTIMNFQGLESQQQALDFAKAVFANLSKAVWGEVKEVPKATMAKLQSKITILFSSEPAVAQARIVQEVQTLFKELL